MSRWPADYEIQSRYRSVKIPGTRRATRIHRLRAESALGKSLPPGAVVHHSDGSRDDNGPLVICQSQAYHRLLHQRMRVAAAGGNPNTDRYCGKCGACKAVDQFKTRRDRPSGRESVCRACRQETANE